MLWQWRNRKNMDKKRYLLIDGIRGLAVISMVIFHFLFDVYIVYAKNPGWYSQLHIHIWQQSICWTFIFTAGFVWQLGQKNNFRRGIFLNICGIAISLITWVVIPTEAIWFGILNFIGCAVLFMIPLHKIMCKVPPMIGMIASFIAFVLFKNVQRGYLGIGDIKLLTLPGFLYRIKVLTPFGFPYPGFASSDYFPMLPWLFLFMTGYFFYFIFEKQDSWKKIAYKRIPILSGIGQKAIWIYLAHQPICMIVCMFLFH